MAAAAAAARPAQNAANRLSYYRHSKHQHQQFYEVKSPETVFVNVNSSKQRCVIDNDIGIFCTVSIKIYLPSTVEGVIEAMIGSP